MDFSMNKRVVIIWTRRSGDRSMAMSSVAVSLEILTTSKTPPFLPPAMTQMSSANESTKLLSPSPPPAVNQATRPTASTSAATWGTFRTVFQLVHGVGETVRGTVLGAIDDLENRGERKHHEIAAQGQAEMGEAYRQLWGTAGESSGAAQVEPTAHATGYDAAPPRYDSTGTGFRPDSKNSYGS